MKLLTLTAVAAATLTACTPHEISVFAALAPHQRDAVADHLNRSADCFTAVDRWWPTSSRARAKQVCERRVVGTRTEMVPDPTAPLVERTVEVVEWECSPVLGGAS